MEMLNKIGFEKGVSLLKSKIDSKIDSINTYNIDEANNLIYSEKTGIPFTTKQLRSNNVNTSNRCYVKLFTIKPEDLLKKSVYDVYIGGGYYGSNMSMDGSDNFYIKGALLYNPKLMNNSHWKFVIIKHSEASLFGTTSSTSFDQIGILKSDTYDEDMSISVILVPYTISGNDYENYTKMISLEVKNATNITLDLVESNESGSIY